MLIVVGAEIAGAQRGGGGHQWRALDARNEGRVGGRRGRRGELQKHSLALLLQLLATDHLLEGTELLLLPLPPLHYGDAFPLCVQRTLPGLLQRQGLLLRFLQV